MAVNATIGTSARTSATLAGVSPDKLAGLAEVAEIFGVTKKTAMKYADHPAFPPPIDRLAAGPVWFRADVERWGRDNLPLPPGPRRKAAAE